MGGGGASTQWFVSSALRGFSRYMDVNPIELEAVKEGL